MTYRRDRCPPAGNLDTKHDDDTHNVVGPPDPPRRARTLRSPPLTPMLAWPTTVTEMLDVVGPLEGPRLLAPTVSALTARVMVPERRNGAVSIVPCACNAIGDALIVTEEPEVHTVACVDVPPIRPRFVTDASLGEAVAADPITVTDTAPVPAALLLTAVHGAGALKLCDSVRVPVSSLKVTATLRDPPTPAPFLLRTSEIDIHRVPCVAVPCIRAVTEYC